MPPVSPLNYLYFLLITQNSIFSCWFPLKRETKEKLRRNGLTNSTLTDRYKISLLISAKKAVILPYFLLWKFYGKAQFDDHSLPSLVLEVLTSKTTYSRHERSIIKKELHSMATLSWFTGYCHFLMSNLITNYWLFFWKIYSLQKHLSRNFL